jgi:hypothetical protein
MLLVVMTFACAYLGWVVDRARRRGDAIDAAVEAGCVVRYLGLRICWSAEANTPTTFGLT